MSRTILAAALAAMASFALSTTANAGIMPGETYHPLIVAGDPNGSPPDSPANRVDPNTPTSPYSGVVSINIRYDGNSYICSGALIDATHVLTAAHCIDTNGNGQTIDLNKPGSDVRVVFNASTIPGSAGRSVITASKVAMHPNYQGFGNCPVGVPGFCVNDDVAIVELPVPAPADAKIYKVHNGVVDPGTVFTMVGYGTSGDGVNGFTISPDFRVKRQGQNVYDLADGDDEQNFGGNAEVWYADFDGLGRDYFCELALACGISLGNEFEAALGGGDSGGPSFADFAGELRLVGNNTFGGTPAGVVPGAFGSYFGGMLLSAYYDWIADNSNMAVPEPGAASLAALGLLGLSLSRRRRRKA